MSHRASPSGVSLNAADAAVAKAMLARGDRQHDVAAWFGVNAGRIAELASGKQFHWVPPENLADCLPPQGPYSYGRVASAALDAIATAEAALDTARRTILQG